MPSKTYTTTTTCSRGREHLARTWNEIEDAHREPFAGIGKPESLRHIGADVWSRRITQLDRLVYRVHGAVVDFLQARYHY